MKKSGRKDISIILVIGSYVKTVKESERTRQSILKQKITGDLSTLATQHEFIEVCICLEK